MPADAAIKTIEAHRFRVGRILELNDPFEYSFGFERFPPAEIKNALVEREELRRHLNELYGVVCFSKEHRDSVIWSHYADCHRGVALEVGCTLEDFEKELIGIVYSKKRICVPLDCYKFREQNESGLRRIFKKMIRRKAWNWRYEHEYRGVVALRECDTKSGMYLWKIPENFIKRVIIGIRSPFSIAYFRRALDLSGFKSVAVVKAQESLNSYAVEFQL